MHITKGKKPIKKATYLLMITGIGHSGKMSYPGKGSDSKNLRGHGGLRKRGE